MEEALVAAQDQVTVKWQTAIINDIWLDTFEHPYPAARKDRFSTVRSLFSTLRLLALCLLLFTDLTG